jgi:cytochrome P450
MLRLIGSVSARFLHSSAASDNEDWIDLATGYTETVIENVQALKPWPPLLRPIANRFLPQHKEILKQWAKGRTIVMSTMNNLRNGKTDDPPSMMHHLSSGKNARLAGNADAQLKTQMTLAAAAIHTTTASVTQVLYDIAARPQFVPELRQEVFEVLERCGGTLTKQALSEMKKLDSWMKESQRVASPDLSWSPFTLVVYSELTVYKRHFNVWPSLL